MHIDRVRQILHRARTQRILVAGDLMLDEYLWGEVTRISPEAPVPVVRVTGESWYPGGAANVARNVRALCAWTGVLGAIGADPAGGRLRDSLRDAGIDVSGLIADPNGSTVVKTRVMARHQQVVRVDRESVPDLAAELPAGVAQAIERLIPEADGIILSDYAKGFLGQSLVDRVCEAAAAHGKVVTVDPSPLNPVKWAGVTAIKPNRNEALRAAGLHEHSHHVPDDMVGVGNRLLESWQTRLILLTLGEEGMLLFERDRPVHRTPARAREVFDVSGAGDTAVAVFTVALCAGAEPAEAAELANAASGIVVGKLGTATVAPSELIADFEAAR
jgi:D-beta-D-heptose 7-phosphate kinase/D-beta-D-heptose 1-phosphate adenosyltransferase